MDKKYSLEALLLSRSYAKSSRVNELLEQRYLTNGKPFLTVSPTVSTDSSTKMRIEHEMRQNKQVFKPRTKQVFKRYLARVLGAQRRAKRTLQSKKNQLQFEQLHEYSIVPKYDDFVKMNELWLGYIQDLLEIDTVRKADKAYNEQQVLLRLCSAEFIGCFMRVVRSTNQNCVGISGIVVYDSKDYFVLVCERTGKDPVGGFKMVEKKGTLFSFVVPLFDVQHDDLDANDANYMEFSVIGSRFQFRSAERSGKKFKSKKVDDLELDI